MIWTMDVLPGIRVPIHLDSNQQLILIALCQELLVDRSGSDRTIPNQVEEETLNQIEEMGSAHGMRGCTRNSGCIISKQAI